MICVDALYLLSTGHPLRILIPLEKPPHLTADIPVGRDVCCFACRATGRLAGSAGLQATGVKPRLRRVSGMAQSGSATTALPLSRAGKCLADDINAARVCGCAGGGWWAAVPPLGGWGQTQTWIYSCRVD